MADPRMQVLPPGPDMLAGAAIPFRFEVTWRSLTRPLGPSSAAPVSKPVLRVPARDAEAKEWEMVLPRMKRPAALAPSIVPRAPVAPEPCVSSVAAPVFASSTEYGSRRWTFPVAAALLVPLAWGALRWTGQHAAPAADPAAASRETGGAGWMSEWASDPTGSSRGRQLALYRPSMRMSDYRLEFSGRIEKKSLGWVFRAVDSRNYYAGKLEAFSTGLAVTHFAVIEGLEGPHIQRVLAMPAGAGTMFRVRLDASGPRFTISVQDQVVEDWDDGRLKRGGVGFLNEREERGQVASVHISFPKGERQ